MPLSSTAHWMYDSRVGCQIWPIRYGWIMMPICIFGKFSGLSDFFQFGFSPNAAARAAGLDILTFLRLFGFDA
jgi:hypothetical protein